MENNNSDFNYSESYSTRELKHVLDSDPMLIWLDKNIERHQYQQNTPSSYDLGVFIDNKTKIMKEHMLPYLESVFSDEVYHIPRSSLQSPEEQVQEQIHQTKKAMKMKKGVIVNPTLFDHDTKIYGTVDLIIRFSLLNKYYDLSHLNSLLPSAFPEDDYVIVFIKFWDISLNPKESEVGQPYVRIKGKTKRKLLPFLPLQKSLNTTSESDKHFVFVLPRDPTSVHTQSTKRIYSFCLFTPKDNREVQKTVIWMDKNIPTLLKNPLGSSSSLAPNMKKSKNPKWSNAKEKIAKDIGELTLLPLSYKQRERLWNEHQITSIEQLLEYYRINRSLPIELPEKKERQLAFLLSTHTQSDSPYYFFDSKHLNSIPNQKQWDVQVPLEFFVDFETANNQNDDFTKFPQAGGFSMIFLIGCSEYIGDKLQFSHFIADEETPTSEKKMITDFYNHIKERTNNFTTDHRIYHWHAHESNKMNQAIKRHNQSQWKELSWFDLCKSFKKSEIYIKNSSGFGLKEIGKSLHSFGKIDTFWPTESEVSGGLEAQFAAWHAYNLKKEGKIHNILEDEAMKEVLEYNQIDCNIMGEILTWMRSTLLPTSSTVER